MYISKIKLINFKKFQNFVLEPNPGMNIIVGDNETGKSTILEAIDLVATASVRKVEAIGLDKLFNIDAIKSFCAGERTFYNLPSLIIELYLNDVNDYTLNGKNNSDGVTCNGLRLVCDPDLDYFSEINQVLTQNEYFPFDYYRIRFSSFADEAFTTYRKKLRSVLINSIGMNSINATNDFVKRMYLQYTEDDVHERAIHKGCYRLMKNKFCDQHLRDINKRLPPTTGYKFALKSASIFGFENDLTILEDEVQIDSKGTGRQVFIKTDFALQKAGTNVDVILLEEPENHLSYHNLRRLVDILSSTKTGQFFITTHNNLICTRLDLNHLQILKFEKSSQPLKLQELSEETVKYFVKAPPAGIIEFILAPKTILVEGPSEYILMERFYETVKSKKPEDDGVNILCIRGLSFKRYLEIARLNNSKVAVITDNDGNFDKNCIQKYKDSVSNNIRIFYNENNELNTFEKVLFQDNDELCKGLFDDVEHMIKHKTESAYKLAVSKKVINVPQYIREAIEWINE
ncbi:MAG TPA: AAA family ATPase [Candidatus Aphodousia faecavium]|nr:AAA family ATPase [Candidatus Aphodousia faecavium]